MKQAEHEGIRSVRSGLALQKKEESPFFDLKPGKKSAFFSPEGYNSGNPNSNSNSDSERSRMREPVVPLVKQKGIAPRIQRFEAPIHESAERQGLTRERSGTSSRQGLTNEEASNVYFGNWMRDVNQAFVPMINNLVGSDLAFALLNNMAAHKFGRLLTPAMLGYYIPTEHIDNPAGLVAQDDLLPRQPTVNQAARLDPASPVPFPSRAVTPQATVAPTDRAVPGSNARLFDVDQTGTMAYIRRTNLHIERRLEEAARMGRNPNGMLHLGAALHAIEDMFAHSNWVEIAVDQVLSERRGLLPALRGQSRRVFSYSRNVRVPGQGRNRNRPVLTTGSFTGADTMVSILSEVVNLLNQPLPEPASDVEREAQERFILAMLTNFEGRLTSDPEFRQALRQLLIENGVNEHVADTILDLPLTRMYNLSRQLSVVLPDFVPELIRSFIRNQIHALMQEVGSRIQAEAISTSISSTSLITALRQNREAAQQPVNDENPTQMERATQRLTGESISSQRRRGRGAASRHYQALRNTPTAVVAGPSHSQISKDHTNSPFFGIAFTMATEAVRRIREKMIVAWGGRSVPFDFSWSNYPEAGDDRQLYHAGRRSRATHETASRERGQRIVRHGGDSAAGEAFTPYSLQSMRNESARRIRAVANALNNVADNPRRAANVLAMLQHQIARPTLPEGTFQILREQLATQLESLRRGATRINDEAQVIASLRRIASELNTTAAAIQRARQHGRREELNNELVDERNALLAPLASLNGPASPLKAALLIVLNDEISRTAVAYTSHQRAVLEGRESLGSAHRGSAQLRQSTINLPDLSRKPPAIRSLLEESRLILNHPYERGAGGSRWWFNHVVRYIQEHPDQIMADIEARNSGYAAFRRPGEHQGHNHGGGP